MIQLDVELPLPEFTLRVDVCLEADVTAVMGPSGAGKTSLLETIAGLRRGATGKIGVAGRVFLDSSQRVQWSPERRRVGFVPQDAGLFPHMSALENVRFGARGDDARVSTVIDVLEIRSLLARRPDALSGGEKQRVALARALAMAPTLLLLDEPLASLDVGLRERILPYLLRVRDEWQVPILYVTHNVGEALALAGHVVLLREGQIQQAGPPLELLTSDAAVDDEIENVLRGRVIAHDTAGGITRVALASGPELAVRLAVGRSIGAAVTLAVPAEDVLVAIEPVSGLSARNIYAAELRTIDHGAVDVTLRCVPEQGGPAWIVRVTPQAARVLQLVPGRRVWLAVKSHSVRFI